MSYLLCLGLVSQKYKKDPTIQIKFDDVFLYEFELESYTSKKIAREWNDTFKSYVYDKEYLKYLSSTDKLSPVNSYYKAKNYTGKHILSQDLKIYFFKVDKNLVLNTKKIKIIIDAKDSNYTNGFMTKSTLCSLRLAYIIPQEIFDNHEKFLNEYDKKIYDYNRTQNTTFDFKKYYANDLVIKNGGRSYLNLLNPDSVMVEDKEKCLQHKPSIITRLYGGYITITLECNNMHKNIDNQCVQNDLLSVDLVYAICNKYKQYENH